MVDRGRASSDVYSSVLQLAAIVWGGSLAMIVGHEGEWRWILTRLAVVGVMLLMLLWAVQHRCWTATSAMHFLRCSRPHDISVCLRDRARQSRMAPSRTPCDRRPYPAESSGQMMMGWRRA